MEQNTICKQRPCQTISDCFFEMSNWPWWICHSSYQVWKKSQGLVTLLHICGVILTPQSPIYLRKLDARPRYRLADVAASSAKNRHIKLRVFERFMMFHKVLRCFTSVSQCFTMFRESHNDRHQRLSCTYTIAAPTL